MVATCSERFPIEKWIARRGGYWRVAAAAKFAIIEVNDCVWLLQNAFALPMRNGLPIASEPSLLPHTVEPDGQPDSRSVDYDVAT